MKKTLTERGEHAKITLHQKSGKINKYCNSFLDHLCVCGWGDGKNPGGEAPAAAYNSTVTSMS